MAKQKNFFLEATAQSTGDMLHRVIGNTFIIEYGIIKAIPATGVVTVEMSVADSAENIIITNCVLANIASSSIAVNVKPNIDDKVLVLFPRKSHSDMYKADKNETIIAPAGTGYNIFSGIAILLNQYQTATHTNFIDFSDGNLTLSLAYDKDNEKNLINLTTDKDGALTLNLGYDSENDKPKVALTSDKDGNIQLVNPKITLKLNADGSYEITNKKSKVTVGSDGYLSYTNTDSNDNKSKIAFTSSGVTIQDKNGCTVTSSKTSIKINNKLEIKK